MAISSFDTGGRTRKKGQSNFIDDGIIGVDISLDEAAVKSVFDGPFTAFKRAAADGVKEAREAALEKGRQNIRSAGFPAAWAAALQARQYPKGGKPASTVTAFINHRFGGVGTVFEFGATIRPKEAKYLWIPADGTKKTVFDPKARKSLRATPARLFNSAKGLAFAIVNGRPALVQKNTKAKKPKVMFWGRKQVYVPKKWNVMPILEGEAANLPAYVEKNLAKLLRGQSG